MHHRINNLILLLLISFSAAAQEVRYVSKSGTYSGDGKSWATAKANIQDAINDLVDHGLTGEVWVAEGTYKPTESNESTGGSTLYMSFKIPAGISVYGGFAGTESSKDDRTRVTAKPIGSVYDHETILSGDLSSDAEFEWNTAKEQWSASFYGNCYHVVFFATNGFDSTTGRAKSNGGGARSALLEGVIIEHGNATNSDINGHPHNAYGGGVYMVDGAHLKNCLVRQCVATRDGGGIYMDGGGYVEHCAVSDCQSIGIGTVHGYGGGVCMNGPDTFGAANSTMVVTRSGVFGCVGRMGGGIAINVNDTTGTNKYKLACTSVIVANNTATSEAGGIYMNRGGAITQMTVARNKCNGAGVITGGVINGRAASIYCRDNAVIANSVMWGGVCKANSDIQFASTRSTNSTALSPNVLYTAVSKSDYTDWSGVIKKEVMKLTTYNSAADGTKNETEGYPLFTKPTATAGYVDEDQSHQFLSGEYDFQPQSRSSLNHRGVLTADLDRYAQTPATDVDYDITGKRYTPRSTLGAYIPVTIEIKPETVTVDGKTTSNFYVDPNDDSGVEYESIGSSWDQPIRFFSDAMTYISEHTDLGDEVNVYVKQGTVNNTNTTAKGHVRNSSIVIPGGVNIYGGYPSDNTGTSLDGRNPNVYITTITANTQDEYDLNVAHLLTFTGVTNTVLNGFSITFANARSTELYEGTAVTSGAALSFDGATAVRIVNCCISGHTASAGAVAELTGNSTVAFENCVFHNNESRAVDASGTATATNGNVVVRAGSSATFCHCDFLRNVGNAIDSYGTVKVVNTVFYGNMREPLDDTRGNADKAVVAVRLLDGGTFTGDHNLYDKKSEGAAFLSGADATNETILDYTFTKTSTTYPRFINPTKNAGVSPAGDVTYYGRAASFMPHNNNPMVNRASTVDSNGNTTDDHTQWGTDMTGKTTRDYGGLPDIGAVENYEATDDDEDEMSYANGQRPYGGAYYVRDYRDSDGNIDTGTDGRDGTSWGKAINGNGTYNGVNGFQYALNQANAEWKNDQSTLREVRVGAGTYTAHLNWYEGVNVKGGYPATGNPGENERDISNSKEGYMTIIDGNKTGRVLLQPADFTSQAVFEGFTIQNGYLTGWDYGAGVYLRSNGVLKNCLVQNNMFIANYNTGGGYGGAGVFLNTGSIVKNCKIMRNTLNSDESGLLVGGAGIYANGGVVINTLIVENTANNSAHNILGAGFFIKSNSSLYNCTIAYNKANETGWDSSNNRYFPATGGVWDAAASHQGNGVYSNQSNFYNCVIWGNYATGGTAENLIQVGMSGFGNGAGSTNDAFHSCYSSAWSSKYASDDATNNTLVNIVGKGTEGAASDYAEFYQNCLANEPFMRDEDGNTDYSLKSTAIQCINQGSEYDALDYYDITVDINGEDRVQDCTIDKGAYEYNQSLDISPEVFTEGTAIRRVFYVTRNGHGTASANSPENAACADKLQKVLDAAGRCKYQYPEDTVIVKVACNESTKNSDSPFKYYACRTTDETDQNVRIWSIMVPRGVEVWGGYSDSYTSATENGFYSKTTSDNKTTITDHRDILANPTYFDSYYYNSEEKIGAHTYHVVTFTDRVFDGLGNPYGADDEVNGYSSYAEGDTYMSLATKTGDRAVIDGLFVTGGKANAQVSTAHNAAANINQYGGAAIVTDYAHVRNCIVRDNEATYGGALALTHNALVSGCLIDQNTADYGGAIYMFENGRTLSDGTVIATKPSTTSAYDANMAHVYTSTIVNNKANSQGGGIWFGQTDDDMNIRVNSTVVWQNNSTNQANVSGLFNPTKTPGNQLSTLEFYPFAYCAIQNQLIPGMNNIQLDNVNAKGVRFAAGDNAADDHKTIATENESATDFAKYDNFGYYALTYYSTLIRNGMPGATYTELVGSAGLAATDFTDVNRLVSTSKNRSNIEIGARALDKAIQTGQLMLRLFVAQPDDIDMDAAQTMMNLATDAEKGSLEEYYSQEGSSFAFPMQNLQDALDYIIEARSLNVSGTGTVWDNANNLPFEICMGKGTYYPKHNMDNKSVHSSGNSFVIPEGVSVYGGFAIGNPDKDHSFFGRYYKAKDNATSNVLSENVETVVGSDADTTVTVMTYGIDQVDIEGMRPRRRIQDNNGNGVVEPWEFVNQTILSGDVNNQSANGVYHVVTVVADQNVTGVLPKTSSIGLNDGITYESYTAQYGEGSYPYETGQAVVLDGLQITSGHAMNYVEGSTGYHSKNNFYCGGGVSVNGNRYCDDYNKGTSAGVEFKHNVMGAVGYRNIPLVIANCRFYNNEAGVGGAIASNGWVDIYQSAFEQNRASAGHETVVNKDGDEATVQYAGVGGALMSTYQLSAINTLFANNEAYDSNLRITTETFSDLKIDGSDDGVKRTMLGGAGGAAYVGPFGFFHFVNCDFVRNQANMYPVVFTKNPNRDFTGTRNGGIGIGSGTTNVLRPVSRYYNKFVSTLFWGNDINEEMSNKWDSNSLFKFNSRLICNYAPGEFDSYDAPDFTNGTNVPKDQDDLDSSSTEEETSFGEVAWFCAYEANRGVSPLNDIDARDIDFIPTNYLRNVVQNTVGSYQNCNILLSSDNSDLEGPNFVNPSLSPGYDGYYEAADWSPSRISNLVDNGSGKIYQTITNDQTSGSYSAAFDTWEEIPERSVNYNGGNVDGYTDEQVGDYKTDGVYTTWRVLNGSPLNHMYMPVGDTQYMSSASTGHQYLRISYDPNPTHNQTYIDIGVYEYQHRELKPSTLGDEVDILWVSPEEKAGTTPDGSSWSQPTSDLQRAIETLLASRNGHRKEIRLMDGVFTPIYSIENMLAFYIDTKSINQSVTSPLSGDTPQTGLGIMSLTIKGGYSRDLNNVYDPQKYPAVIRQQTRSSDTSNRWDHLFYIYDGTQRYGYEKYDESNGYGHYATVDGAYDQTVNTIPLQIDGVTLINTQANKNVNGAAIHYKDLDDIVTSPTEAHVTYTKTEDDGTTTTHWTTNADNKFIISKCKIINSGSFEPDDYSSSAVYIGKNGGSALLYNDVMHSNQGNPLVSAVPTTIVNNTYALNHGSVNLDGTNSSSYSIDIDQNNEDTDDDSEMLAPIRRTASLGTAATESAIFNTVFWRNNDNRTQFILPGFVSLEQSGAIFSHNACTGLSTEWSDYEEPQGYIVKANYNVGLSDDNTDVINGPNFTDPKVDAVTEDEIEARDFTLQPSLRLLNKGSDDFYDDNVTGSEDDTYNIYDVAWVTTTRTDAGGNERFCYTIDMGAYEYQNNLNRIIYVNPNISSTGLGNSWSSPVAYGNLQNAIDLAAVYHVNNSGEEAYVFVKGASAASTGLHLGETITMRNGVSVYGGILPTRTEDCKYTESSASVRTYTEEDIKEYITAITAERDGVASLAANKTTVSGIKASDTFTSTNENIVALVDGFDVTATNSKNTTGTVTAPVIDIQPSNIGGRVAVRNIIVHDNDLSGTTNVDLATVDNALIYEALFRDNKVDRTGRVLTIGNNGYGVNLTVEGETYGTTRNVYNSLINYGGVAATEQTLSGYNYKVTDPNLNYQLTERSGHIDECDATNPIESVASLAQFINYDTDRDLLGNPRLLKGVSGADKIDRGAFETWRVENDVTCTTADADGDLTHYYPHHGSVVYLMEGKSLTLASTLRPAYLLVKDGASLYGNGHAVEVGYVGVERQMSKDGSMVSLPYAMRYRGTDAATKGVGAPRYSTDGVLTVTTDKGSSYIYNGVGRSAWNNKFYKTESPLWTEQTDADEATEANQGVLYKTAADGLYRFTAQGDADDMDVMVYTETAGDISKTVVLKQYDDRTSTDGGADFTDKEDMGWNCIGLPYLVSDYNPAEMESLTSDSHYNMNIPHTLWLWYDGVTYPDGTTKADGDGGFYSVPSWDDNDWHLAEDEAARIWVGEGFFTQTAAVADTEKLTFYRPVPPAQTAPAKRRSAAERTTSVRLNARYYVGETDGKDMDSDLTVRVDGHVVYVCGLTGGETVTIYDMSGRACSRATATGEEYSTTVTANGVYIVRVNGLSHKIIIR